MNNINKKRPSGRRKQGWLDVVKREIMDLTPEWISYLNHAYNRKKLNKLVVAAKSLYGL